MNITKEKLEVVFNIEKEVPRNVLEKFDLEIINETLVRGKVSQEEQLFEYISGMSPYFAEKEDIGIMLLKTYHIKTFDEIEASNFLNSLFLPQFQMEEYALSNINFYTNKNDVTYSVDIDYGFEDKITIKIGTYIDENDDCHEILKDFSAILLDILGEECNNACSK